MLYQPQTLKGTVAVTPARDTARPSHLLDLPGELRNVIYDYVFEDTSVLIGNFPGRAQVTSAGHWWQEPDFVRQIAELSNLPENREVFYFPVSGPRKDAPEARMMEKMMRNTALGPKDRLIKVDKHGRAKLPLRKPYSWAGLLMACKQVYIEAAPAYYSRINFVFGCQRSIKALLAHPPHKNCARIPQPIKQDLLTAITQVSLSMDDWPGGKGNPEYQARYYRSWRHSCDTIVDKLPNLSRAVIAVNALYKCPFMLTFKELWVTPLLSFARATNLVDFTLMIKMPMGYFVWSELADAFAEALRVRIVEDDEDAGLRVIAQGMKRYGKISSMGEDLTPYWHTLATWNGVQIEE